MVVELKIKKKNPWAGLLKYKGCNDYIAPYWTRSGMRYTGLTPEDEEYFEKALGYEKGTLSRTSDFWINFCVKIGTRTLILDDSIPRQAMIIKFLSGHKRVATSLDKFTAGKDYLLINRQAEAIEANKINKQRRDAIVEFGKLSLDQMRKCLRLFGINGERMSNELIESTLFNLIDKQPKKFFDLWVNNKSKETQFILEQAVAKGVIRKEKTQYYYGTDMIADSLNEAIAYLDSKKNQDLRLAIINETNNK
jgi:hypothetical protein|nr:MAG: hypothetical protein [Bacteriophage sp.]DAF65994.1 MAG TPA: hypothetical protein [Caudoviricetes sp.]DAH00443.1 MAG TPA: hypothetical protein [Crassvirales sp.]DAH40573.1 MAG TPA: hypothetical protein [Caudoviricetes sp.]